MALPSRLREVSGVVAVDERTIACVQDEAGALFFVDLRGERPLRSLPFGPRGDYEGLAKVGADWWVLRSDGFLMRLKPDEKGLGIAASWHLQSEHQEYEGLCHDAARGVLLVLPKDRAGDGKRARDRRSVLVFDPAGGALRREPAVTVSVKELIADADARGIELPIRTTPKGKERIALDLFGSEILAVPGSDDLLLLSAADHVLLRIARDGRLVGSRLLPEDGLPQPEAMTFLADGRLLVASEGVGGPGRLRIVEPPAQRR